jgi:hypothetical protein
MGLLTGSSGKRATYRTSATAPYEAWRCDMCVACHALNMVVFPAIEKTFFKVFSTRAV